MTLCVPLVLQDAVRYLEKLAGLLLFLACVHTNASRHRNRDRAEGHGPYCRALLGHLQATARCSAYAKREGTKLMDWIVWICADGALPRRAH